VKALIEEEGLLSESPGGNIKESLVTILSEAKLLQMSAKALIRSNI